MTADLLALLGSDPAAGILAVADLRDRRATAETGRVHELKTRIPAWRSLSHGARRVEIRRDDRNYRVGDLLVLREWDHGSGSYTGNECRAVVQHVLYQTDLSCGSGLVSGYVALTVEANPAHALAAVRRWWGVVERHGKPGHKPCGAGHWQPDRRGRGRTWITEDCPDLAETADEAKAYLGGSQ